MRTPTSETAWAFARLAMAALILAAVLTQFVVSVSAVAASQGDVATVVVNFFSFFTILSNVLATIALAWAAITALRGRPAGRSLSIVLAGATTYMLITGVVYNALLRFIELPQGGEPVWWSNEVLHLVGPLFLLVDLLFGARRRVLRRRAVLVIIAFPLVWTAYTLVRGPLVTNPLTGAPFWYPYPFLNPNNPGGWSMVIAYVAVISVAFVVAALFTVVVSARRGRVAVRA